MIADIFADVLFSNIFRWCDSISIHLFVENVSLTTYTAAGTRMDKIQPLFFPNDQSVYTYIFSAIYVLNIHVYMYLLCSINFHFGLSQWKRIFNRWSYHQRSVTNLNAILLYKSHVSITFCFKFIFQVVRKIFCFY